MAEIPCGLIAHAERALESGGRHALFGFAQQIDGGKPLRQAAMGIMEDRSRRYGELVAA